MNLHFLKLRVATDPWILVDRCGAEPSENRSVSNTLSSPEEESASPDWETAASLVCHPYRGAAARGLLVVDGGTEPFRVQAWSPVDGLVDVPPVAALCAARWLFDTGRAIGDTVSLATRAGSIEVLVLDSRNFGLSLGRPRASVERRPSPDMVSIELLGKCFRARLHDGAIPRAPAGPTKGLIQVGCVARAELQLRVRGMDILEAAGASVAAASLTAYADRDCGVLAGGDRIIVQWPASGPMFIAAAPLYCMSGDYWLEDHPDSVDGLT